MLFVGRDMNVEVHHRAIAEGMRLDAHFMSHLRHQVNSTGLPVDFLFERDDRSWLSRMNVSFLAIKRNDLRTREKLHSRDRLNIKSQVAALIIVDFSRQRTN